MMGTPFTLILLSAVYVLATAAPSRNSRGLLDFTFMLEGEEVSLNLKENPHIRPDFPVILANNGRFTRWNSPSNLQDFAVFLDPERGASLLVKNGTTADGRQDASYIGLFNVAGSHYVIEPASHPEAKRNRRSMTFSLDHLTSVDHVIYQPVTDDLTFDDTRGTGGKYEQEWADFVQSATPQGQSERVIYAVELFLILDYPIYKGWYDRSTKSSHQEREKDAIQNIRYYFAHIANGIDMRYQSIDEPDYGIYVKLAGIMIAQTPEDSSWTTKSKNCFPGYPRNHTDAYYALDDFEDWIKVIENDESFPVFDSAMTFTGNDLFGSIRDDGSYRGIGGLADIKGICTDKRAAVCQEGGQYASIQTGAHELGHNVGANHDGDSNVGCTSRDQYIMANSPGVLTDDNYHNALTFSPCTRKSFRDHQAYLVMKGENCLLNQVDHFNKEEMIEHLSVLPGQRYTPDEQCTVIYGPKSFHCAGGKSDNEICRKMNCLDPGQDRCYGHTEQRSAEGTTCGNHKWCILGDCVYDEKAPASPDSCIYGDLVPELLDKRTCHEVVTDFPWDCYRDDYFTDCCQSCANLRNDSWPGCEFGDHDQWCPDILRRDCYSESTTERCCTTCLKQKGSDPNCLYGDRASWCTTIDAGSCYVNEELCCETCPKLHTGDDSCPYGDTASWCPGFITEARLCYGNDEKCCHTCKRHNTGVPGCEYGDSEGSCTQNDCEDSRMREKCCATCGYSTGTTLPPDPDCVDTASWCSTMPISDCYVSAHTCCDTCRRNYDPSKKSCEYGDHVSWCGSYVTGPDSCKTSDIQTKCCETCERYL